MTFEKRIYVYDDVLRLLQPVPGEICLHRLGIIYVAEHYYEGRFVFSWINAPPHNHRGGFTLNLQEFLYEFVF